MYRLHGAIHAYGGTAVSARDTADSVITALSPAAWYRNATGVTSAGGFASQWDDYSGNARHLVQATGTNQPAYAAGVFTFDGADNTMKVTGGFSLSQPETIYIVFNQVSWTNADYIFDGNTSSVGALYQNATTPRIRLYAGVDSTQNANAAVGTRVIVCCVFNGASSVTRVNNTADVGGNSGASNMGGFTLGSSGGASLFSNIAVEEVVIFPALHDDATRSSVITALNDALTVF